MADMFDRLAGEEPDPGDRPRRSSSPGWGKAPRKQRHVSDAPSRAQRNTRPAEVSERVWGLAEQWLEMGEAQFGKRPPVNKQEFAKRLSAKINTDQTLRSWRRRKPEFWAKFGAWEDAAEFLDEVLAKAMELFFKYLTEEQKNTSSLQFAFLDNEWDEWIYQAVDAVKIRWLKANGHWEKYRLPKAVFDRSLPPDPDAVHPDPFHGGKTYAEVEAENDVDIQALPELTDEDYEHLVAADREKIAESRGRIARLKDVMLANRSKTTTKENHHG